MNKEENDDDSCFLPPSKTLCFDLDQFRTDMVQVHNRYRALHDSTPLDVLPGLEDSAQCWAEHAAARRCLLYCEQLKNTGESLFKINLASTSPPTAKDIGRRWYREIKEYTFADPRWRRGAVHFTQMVWRNSQHIGIGVAPVPGEPLLFGVVRYFPGGNSNYPGEFQRNVQPRKSLKSSDSFLDDSSFVRTYSGRFRSISYEDAYI